MAKQDAAGDNALGGEGFSWKAKGAGMAASFAPPKHEKLKRISFVDTKALGFDDDHLLDRERALLQKVYGAAAVLGAMPGAGDGVDDPRATLEQQIAARARVPPHHVAFWRTTAGRWPHEKKPPWRSARSKDMDPTGRRSVAAWEEQPHGTGSATKSARRASHRGARSPEEAQSYAATTPLDDPYSVEAVARRALVRSRGDERTRQSQRDVSRRQQRLQHSPSRGRSRPRSATTYDSSYATHHHHYHYHYEMPGMPPPHLNAQLMPSPYHASLSPLQSLAPAW